MAADAFNSLTGYSVGIPPVPVIDANGNVVTNVLTTGNVTANTIYADNYRYANGQPIAARAGGSNTQVQYNNNNNFAGSVNFTFDSATNLLSVPSITLTGNVSLGNVGNVKLFGGNNGYFLQTDGTGNLSWAQAGNGGGGNGSPGGSNSQIQFNSAGSFAGSPGLQFNSVTNTVTTGNVVASIFTGNLYGVANSAVVAASVTNSGQPNITSVGNLVSLNVTGNALANFITSNTGANLGNAVTANYFIGNLYGNANGASTANTVTNNAQPNITSVGNLTALIVIGDITGNGNANINGNITSNGNITADNANLGNLVTSNYFSGLGANLLSLNVTENITSGNANLGNAATANYFIGSGANLTNLPAANLVGTVPLANKVTDNAQPNITSVGTLTGLALTGILSSNANIGTSANVTANNINFSRTIYGANGVFVSNVSVGSNLIVGSFGGTLTALSNVNTSSSPNVTLGDVGNLHIDGGYNGYFLQTDGLGNLTWSQAGNGGGGGNGTPGGSNTQVQYNDSGSFNGSPYFVFNEETKNVTIGGNLIANTFTIGSGIYKFAHSFVEFLVTNSTANVVMYSLPVEGIASVDYTIISTDPVGGSRQISKISSVVYDTTVDYNEVNTLIVGNLTAEFSVSYDAGYPPVEGPQIQLYVQPTSTNAMTHKICVTAYAD
jgi:hypothetical protein